MKNNNATNTINKRPKWADDVPVFHQVKKKETKDKKNSKDNKK